MYRYSSGTGTTVNLKLSNLIHFSGTCLACLGGNFIQYISMYYTVLCIYHPINTVIKQLWHTKISKKYNILYSTHLLIRSLLSAQFLLTHCSFFQVMTGTKVLTTTNS